LAGIPWIIAGCSGINGRTTATSITNFSESTTQTNNDSGQPGSQRERVRVSTTQAGNTDSSGSKDGGKSTSYKNTAKIPNGCMGNMFCLRGTIWACTATTTILKI
jgi:hypothetical protein